MVDLLNALFYDNRTLLETITRDQVANIVALLYKRFTGGDATGGRVLALLSQLCASGDTPIVCNQHYISSAVLDPQYKELMLNVRLATTEDPATKPSIVILREIGSFRFRNEEGVRTCDVCLDRFVNSPPGLFTMDQQTLTYPELLFRFYVQSMRLYQRMTLGRNRVVIAKLLQHAELLALSYPELLRIFEA